MWSPSASLFPSCALSICPKTIFQFAVPRFSTGAFLSMNTSIPLMTSKKTCFYPLASLGGSILSPLGEFLNFCFLSRLLTFLDVFAVILVSCLQCVACLSYGRCEWLCKPCKDVKHVLRCIKYTQERKSTYKTCQTSAMKV